MKCLSQEAGVRIILNGKVPGISKARVHTSLSELHFWQMPMTILVLASCFPTAEVHFVTYDGCLIDFTDFFPLLPQSRPAISPPARELLLASVFLDGKLPGPEHGTTCEARAQSLLQNDSENDVY